MIPQSPPSLSGEASSLYLQLKYTGLQPFKANTMTRFGAYLCISGGLFGKKISLHKWHTVKQKVSDNLLGAVKSKITGSQKCLRGFV